VAISTLQTGALAKELEDKTFAMKAGDISDVIRTKQGYVILKVNQHQVAGIPDMKDVLLGYRMRSIIKSCSPLFALTSPNCVRRPTLTLSRIH